MDNASTRASFVASTPSWWHRGSGACTRKAFSTVDEREVGWRGSARLARDEGYGDTMSNDTYTDKRWRRCRAGGGVAALAILSTACGSSTNTAGSTTPSTVVAQNVVGKRYCEVLLVHPSPTLLTATVYNTYPLNDCPEAKWAALDAASIAAANHVPFAELNGPRFWLMNSIAKSRHGHEVIKTFGGIAMIEEATVVLGTSVAGD